MGTHIAAWEDVTVPLGPFDEEEDPGTEFVRPHDSQVIPGYYASLLIHRQGINAKTAYKEIHGAIQARDDLVLCRDVLVWLRAVCTARGGGGLQNGVPVVNHPLAPVHVPEAVYEFLTSKVRGDLSALAGETTVGAELTGTLARALRALTRTTGAGGVLDDTDDRGAKEPKAVQDVYRETYSTLLRYCNVKDTSEVAPVRRRLANCTKSERNTNVTHQELVQRVCTERNLAPKSTYRLLPARSSR